MKKFIAAFCIITLLFCSFSVNIFAEQTEKKAENDILAETPENAQPENESEVTNKPEDETEDTEKPEDETEDTEKPEDETEDTEKPDDTEQPEDDKAEQVPQQPEATEIVFKDVPENAWYKEYVDYAATNKLFEGTDKNQFSPDMTMTRAQVVQVLANLSGADISDVKQKSKFTDLEKDAWYTAAVIWAAENKVAEGTSDDTFAPNDPVTREQMCVMFVNYVENFLGESFKGTAAIIPFDDDKEISDWARYSVYICRRAELIDGTGNGSFEPKAEASRAVAATIFTDFHKKYITK